MTTRLRSRVGRLVALTTAALTAAVLAAPGADAWPMAGQDPANTRQADTSGPSDPGLKWFTDIEDLDGDYLVESQVDAAGGSENGAPIVADDGTVIHRVWNDAEGHAALLGLDPDDGSLAWDVQAVARRCTPAIDSQDRLWVLFQDSADNPDLDHPTLRGFNPSTGVAIPGAELELTDLPASFCERSSLHVGGSPEHLVLLHQTGDPSLAVIDISGGTPSLAWADNDLAFDEVLRDGNQARIGAFTSDELLLPVMTDEVFQLLALDLSNGSEVARVDLPVYDSDGQVTADTSRLSAGRLLVADGQVVVGGNYFAASGNEGLVHIVEVSTWQIDDTWTHPTRHSTSGSGPTMMALSGSTVVFNSDHNVLFGYDLDAGTEASWSGDLTVREGGGAIDFDVITDAGGNIYTAMSPGTGETMRLIRYSPAGQTDWRVPVTALQAETGIEPGPNLRFAAVTSAGDLVVYGQNVDTHSHVYAIDSSGGLAEEEQCQLPFTDVSEGSTHALAICRLVERGITQGVGDDRYNPGGNVTRAQMATFLARALELDPVAEERFPDVDPDSTHAPNINAIAEAGITLGRGDGTYDPGGTVTRAEMASFLARAAELEGVSGTGFNDVDPNSTHAPNIYAVRDADITQGTTATTFNPDGNVRRDQMASFLMRMVDHLDEQG